MGRDITPYLPSAWSKYNLLDAQTSALAKQNTEAGLSSIARLREARQYSLRDLLRSLAARGGTRRGSKLWGQNRINLNYERDTTDKRNAMLANIANMLSSYGNTSYSRLMGNQSQMANLMNMFASSYNPGAYSGVNQSSTTPWSGSNYVGYEGPYGTVTQGIADLYNTSVRKSDEAYGF